MSWINSFDPGAKRSREDAAAAAINVNDPPRNGSSFQFSRPSTVAASAAATAPRPRPIRPPTRSRAAPPAASLRSEDAQPNENPTRTKPWEINAPPSIGTSRAKKQSLNEQRQPTRSSSRFGSSVHLQWTRPSSSRPPLVRPPFQPARHPHTSLPPPPPPARIAPHNTSPSSSQGHIPAVNSKGVTHRGKHAIVPALETVPTKRQRPRESSEDPFKSLPTIQPQSNHKSGLSSARYESILESLHLSTIPELCDILEHRPSEVLRFFSVRQYLAQVIGSKPNQPLNDRPLREVGRSVYQAISTIVHRKYPDRTYLSTTKCANFEAQQNLSSLLWKPKLHELQDPRSKPAKQAFIALWQYFRSFGKCLLEISFEDADHWCRQHGFHLTDSPTFDQNRRVDGASQPTQEPPSGSLAEITSTPSQSVDTQKTISSPVPTPPLRPSERQATSPTAISLQQSSVEESAQGSHSKQPPLERDRPTLARLNGVMSILMRPSARPPLSTPAIGSPKDAREAEELAQFLEEMPDDLKSASSDDEASPSNTVPSSLEIKRKGVSAGKHQEEAANSTTDQHPSGPAVYSSEHSFPTEVTQDPRDDEEDLPLALRSSLMSRRQQEDSDEDVPLQQLLASRSSAAPPAAATRSGLRDGSAPASAPRSSTAWSSAVFSAKIRERQPNRTVAVPSGLSIRFLAPLASVSFDPALALRSPKAAYDCAVAVSENGKVAALSEHVATMQRRSTQFLKFRSVASSGLGSESPIEKVEDVRRLTSKVCGIASSTRRLLGIGKHDDQPAQVSLVTVDDVGNKHKVYHLEEHPHPQGCASISPFPKTDLDSASSIDFATGGVDGVVNHWKWSPRSTPQIFRLHTIHDSKPVVALEHLSSKPNILASASIGTVLGFDISAMTLGFSWNTSDRLVHLQRTPNSDLMLGVLARRDYDQFRMYDISGRAGPISRPVISFGWLNDAEGKLPLGRGSFHPTRRPIFAHGAEDGHLRIWDLRKTRDPLLDTRLGDEPIVQVLWASELPDCDAAGAESNDDTLHVATTKGIRSVSLELVKNQA